MLDSVRPAVIVVKLNLVLTYVYLENLALLPVGFAVAMSTSMTLRLLFNIRRPSAFSAITFTTAEAPSTLSAASQAGEDQFYDTAEFTSIGDFPERSV